MIVAVACVLSKTPFSLSAYNRQSPGTTTTTNHHQALCIFHTFCSSTFFFFNIFFYTFLDRIRLRQLPVHEA